MIFLLALKQKKMFPLNVYGSSIPTQTFMPQYRSACCLIIPKDERIFNSYSFNHFEDISHSEFTHIVYLYAYFKDKNSSYTRKLNVFNLVQPFSSHNGKRVFNLEKYLYYAMSAGEKSIAVSMPHFLIVTYSVVLS